MLGNASALERCGIEATDGPLGTVRDFLFDDTSWRIRWLVVDTGHWLPGRKVLLHPSALGQPDPALRTFPVTLTRQQVHDSPESNADEPVSQQLQTRLFDHYGWDPNWADSYFPLGPVVSPFVAPVSPAAGEPIESGGTDTHRSEGDPHLRSVRAIVGYHTHATDGGIGHVDDCLVEDASWGIRYIIVDTKTWGSGGKVLISPACVREIDWQRKRMQLAVLSQQVKDSPRYNPSVAVDRTYEELLHNHYDWQGYWLPPGDHTDATFPSSINPPYLDA